MKLYLHFDLEKNQFPIDYRRYILSFFKQSLTKTEDGKYFDEYFDDINTKDYTFAVILDKPKFHKNSIELESTGFKVLFSTESMKTGLIFYNGFVSQINSRFLLVNKNSMKLKNITKQKEEKLVSNKAVFKTLSPLCVRNHNKETNRDEYYTYDSPQFMRQLIFAIKNNIKDTDISEELAEDIKFTPIQCKKVVVKNYEVFIDTTVGIFILEGDSRLLNRLYMSGMGNRTNLGYGSLSLIMQEHSK